MRPPLVPVLLAVSACAPALPGAQTEGADTSTGTTVDPSTSASTGSLTTGTVTTEPLPGTTSAPPPCDEDLECDPDESIETCLHDCATCNHDASCDADETPYHCPDDCPASACNHDSAIDPLTEQCDDGNADDTDACTNACNHARCGDGLLHMDVEACDDGNLLPGDGCDAACARETLLVFVSSSEFKGNLLPSLDNKQGLALADAHCQALASQAGLQGSFMAWLADGAQGPKDRFSLPDPYSGLFTLTNGTLLASGWQDLTDGSLDHPIDVDEKGELASSAVWTNTNPEGTSAGTDACLGWSSAGTNAAGYGLSDQKNYSWTNHGSTVCALSARLYCFQVP